MHPVPQQPSVHFPTAIPAPQYAALHVCTTHYTKLGMACTTAIRCCRQCIYPPYHAPKWLCDGPLDFPHPEPPALSTAHAASPSPQPHTSCQRSHPAHSSPRRSTSQDEYQPRLTPDPHAGGAPLPLAVHAAAHQGSSPVHPHVDRQGQALTPPLRHAACRFVPCTIKLKAHRASPVAHPTIQHDGHTTTDEPKAPFPFTMYIPPSIALCFARVMR